MNRAGYPQAMTDTLTTKEGIRVEVGQLWRNLDRRMNGRVRKVVAVLGERVIMDETDADFFHSKRPTRVSIRRMHKGSTGWELVK